MESAVPSAMAPTFRPTFHEFKNFRQYIDKLEQKKIGFALIIPPPEFKPETKEIPNDMSVNVFSQNFEKIGRCYNISYMEEEKMNNTDSAIEDSFWKSLSRSKECKKYSLDNHMSLFSDSCKYWNLNKFTAEDSLIHGKDEIEGVTSPYVYVGRKYASFGMHLEDGNAYSINYNHSGKRKWWYFVKDAKKLEKLAHEIASKTYDCTFYIRHKTFLFPPSLLRDNGIEFARIQQGPGEFVLSFSDAYHQGFNEGVNLSEAVNFGSRCWLPKLSKHSLCECNSEEMKISRITLEVLNNMVKEVVAPNTHFAKYVPMERDGSRRRCSCGGLSNFICTICNIFLCFTPNRNCFYEYHKNNFPDAKHLPANELQTKCESRSRCKMNCNINKPSNLTKIFCFDCDAALCLSNNRNCFMEHHQKLFKSGVIDGSHSDSNSDINSDMACSVIPSNLISAGVKEEIDNVEMDSTQQCPSTKKKSKKRKLHFKITPAKRKPRKLKSGKSEAQIEENFEVVQSIETMQADEGELPTLSAVTRKRTPRKVNVSVALATETPSTHIEKPLDAQEEECEEKLESPINDEPLENKPVEPEQQEDAVCATPAKLPLAAKGNSTIKRSARRKLEYVDSKTMTPKSTQRNLSERLVPVSSEAEKSIFGKQNQSVVAELIPIQLVLNEKLNEPIQSHDDIAVLSTPANSEVDMNLDESSIVTRSSKRKQNPVIEFTTPKQTRRKSSVSFAAPSITEAQSLTDYNQTEDILEENQIENLAIAQSIEKEGASVQITVNVEAINDQNEDIMTERPKQISDEVPTASNEHNFELGKFKANMLGKFRIPKLMKTSTKTLPDPEYKYDGQLKMAEIEAYDIPEEIKDIEFNGNIPLSHENLALEPKTIEEYIFKYTSLVYLEEAASLKRLVDFDLEKVKLRLRSRKDQTFQIVDDLESEGMSMMIRNYSQALEHKVLDKFTITTIGTNTPMVSHGHLIASGKSVLFKVVGGFDSAVVHYKEFKFKLNFISNRFTYEVQLNALSWFKKHDLFVNFIENPLFGDSPLITEPNTLLPNVFRSELAQNLNFEQKLAVKKIVNSQGRLVPLLLFGPPGTGKTRTLVASILEIILATNDCVLVCAQSNAACDEITERLLKVLGKGQLIRLYAKSHDSSLVCDTIQSVSNLIGNNFQIPPLEFLYTFRVVVCTLMTASCFTRANGNPEYKLNHFKYIMIDEAASVTEAVTMVAIAGLCTSPNKVHGSLILSGDPKQLEPVVISDFAIKCGLKRSYMERLFEKPCYKGINGNFDPRYTIQLRKNYRSHREIMHMPNSMFYNGKLEYLAPAESTNRFIDTALLPNKEFPIIFDSVEGQCEKSGTEFSPFNNDEAVAVVKWVIKLLSVEWKGWKVSSKEIGIVTPYHKQGRVIKSILEKEKVEKHDEICVGSAEVFQGQERPIIIISTVRSNNGLGFVNDEKRLNVMITRPMALLIIVGNHDTLSDDDNWKKFIDYICEKGALIKNSKKLHPRI